MGRNKGKTQGSKQRGRGKKRRHPEDRDEDDSNNEGDASTALPMKLKIRIGGHSFKGRSRVPPTEVEEDQADIHYADYDCSVEEEVVNEEMVVDNDFDPEMSNEHYQPDASYFEEVIDDDNVLDCDNVSSPADNANNKGFDELDSVNNYDDDDEDDEIEVDDVRKKTDEIDGEDPDVGNESSDEERKWLDALESGQLNENGEVKGSGRPNIALTARQRALLYGEKPEELLELSSVRPAEITEEQLMKRKKKALRRKQLEVEKTERDKKVTLERLLKKQDNKLKNKNLPNKGSIGDKPHYRYTNNSTSIQISVPLGFDFPLEKKSSIEPKTVVLCSIEGCNNAKRYSCSTTSAPLCSLECYKKNLVRLSSAQHPSQSSSSTLQLLTPSPSPLQRPSIRLGTVF